MKNAFLHWCDLIENYNDNLLFLEQQVSFLTNYYPNTKITGHNLLCKTIENNGDFEFAWNSILNGEYISIQKIIEYSNKLNKELLTGDLLFKIAGCSYLSSFGQKNIDEIKPFAEIGLENYKREKNCCNFFDLFVYNGSPIKSKKTGKLVIASDSENIIKDYITGRYEKAFNLFKSNGLFFPNTNIDYFNVSLDDFQKSVDTYKINVLKWQKVFKCFVKVCPASHIQKSTNKAETEDYIIERIS